MDQGCTKYFCREYKNFNSFKCRESWWIALKISSHYNYMVLKPRNTSNKNDENMLKSLQMAILQTFTLQINSAKWRHLLDKTFPWCIARWVICIVQAVPKLWYNMINSCLFSLISTSRNQCQRHSLSVRLKIKH